MRTTRDPSLTNRSRFVRLGRKLWTITMTEIRLAYGSRARLAADAPDIRAIETASLGNNARLGVTGALYFDGAGFFQVLEGPENAVAVLYDRIRKDPRHDQVALVCRHAIAHRMFGLWSMKVVNGLDQPRLRATFEAAADAAPPPGTGLDPRIAVLQKA